MSVIDINDGYAKPLMDLKHGMGKYTTFNQFDGLVQDCSNSSAVAMELL